MGDWHASLRMETQALLKTVCHGHMQRITKPIEVEEDGQTVQDNRITWQPIEGLHVGAKSHSEADGPAAQVMACGTCWQA
jgi:hypothetical protein